ncbi:MAG: 4-(cytidine 5'-diphospho)-2-C-methyl-D-erythritol kinase [Dysgonamonadaceae bacterium]|jgi:4-diphosphocytidyl-2-C-methyl-D-erythritol kinase|nr:4-(cytidine 5'-diphospho)-2-C-methyl-D-erythritol kinase [Dysgonamonadaceae bacterium]
MICFPNAKINLGLNVVERRTDGYHNIETVFMPIPLCDVLEVVPSENGKTTLIQTGINIDGKNSDNLVMKAYNLLKKDFHLPSISIFLRKEIPSGAGLGGGSSDAAFMIKLLNDFANLGLSNETMEDYASQLGADCPFFIRNKPLFAEGIGNIFTPINISLAGYELVIVKPDVHVSTREAYAMIKPHTPEFPLKEVIRSRVEEWKYRLVNDFEGTVFSIAPEIGHAKQEMYDAGAVYAAMSGSGSAVFGIFEKNHFLPVLKSTITGRWSL